MNELKEILEEVCKAAGYTPNHQTQFSGDRIIAVVEKLAKEHEEMKKRLMALGEIGDWSGVPDMMAHAGTLFWKNSGRILSSKSNTCFIHESIPCGSWGDATTT